MSWVVTAVVATAAFSVGSAVLQQKASRKAQKEAKADAIEAEKQARKAEVFAETEGEGVGSLGQISLEVDDDEVKSEVGSTIRI
jgi:hypothetical protein